MPVHAHSNSLHLKDVNLYTNKHKKPKHRINEPKRYLLPIRISAGNDLRLIGYIINMSHYLTRVDITFKAIKKDRLIEKILFNPNITLESIEIGDKIALLLKAPLDILWNKYLCVNDNDIYEIGLTLYLKEAQIEAWREFYNSLHAMKSSLKQLLQI